MMAHFAEIDDNNTVIRVLVVPNDAEDRGQDYLANDLNLGGTWIQTSYNANIRKNYAGVGFTYDAERDAFIAPKPFESWLLDEETCQWKAPIEYPTDGIMYQWNETDKDWEAIVNESN
jgi:hypothetical protein